MKPNLYMWIHDDSWGKFRCGSGVGRLEYAYTWHPVSRQVRLQQPSMTKSISHSFERSLRQPEKLERNQRSLREVSENERSLREESLAKRSLASLSHRGLRGVSLGKRS